MNTPRPSSQNRLKLTQKTGTSLAIIGLGILLAAIFFFTQTSSSTNNALDFDGVDDHVQLSDLNPAGTSYTKEAWVYATATNCNHFISSRYASFWVYNGHMRAGNNNNHYVVRDPGTFPINTWVHVAVTYDASTSTLTLYRDGVEVKTSTSSPPNVGGDLNIGKNPFAGCHFAGQMDEVRIWNYARSEAEIQSTLSVTLNPPLTGLVGYYQFDDGIASADNTAMSETQDASGNGQAGTLSGLALNGTTSNFVASTVGISAPPLPVEWVDFTAKINQEIIALDWSTASELNNTGFEIERQAGNEWQRLDFVASQGTGNQIQRYQYSDLTPLPGENTYRLKQIDQDGGFSYSRLRTVFLGETESGLNLFPNPAQEKLTIEVGKTVEKATLQVFDLQGRLILHEVKSTGKSWELGVSLLEAGTYLLKVSTGTETMAARFVKEN